MTHKKAIKKTTGIVPAYNLLLDRELAAVALFTVIGVYIDYAVIHPDIFGNAPAFSYYAIKLLLVGGVAYGVVRLMRPMGHSLHYRLHLGFVLGLLALQVYYGLYAVPMMSGEAVQVGLWPSIKHGMLVHGGAFLVPIAVVGLVDYS